MKPKVIVQCLKSAPADLLGKFENKFADDTLCVRHSLKQGLFFAIFPFSQDYDLDTRKLSTLQKWGLKYYVRRNDKYSYNRSPLEDEVLALLTIEPTLLAQSFNYNGTFCHDLTKIKSCDTLIFLDFEAFNFDFSTNPDQIISSEIGAARVQSGEIVATFHAFLDQKAQIAEHNIGKICSLEFVRQLTNIPFADDAEYQSLRTVSEAEAFADFVDFCTLSSSELSSCKAASVVKNFQAVDSLPILVAKGKQLEQLLLNRMNQRKNKIFVQELDDVSLRLLKVIIKPSSYELHGKGKKTFDFCDHHKDGQLVVVKQAGQKVETYPHCALDDACCIARLWNIQYQRKFQEVIE